MSVHQGGLVKQSFEMAVSIQIITLDRVPVDEQLWSAPCIDTLSAAETLI